jgi:predicted transposase YbfD/YdcC
MKRLKRLGHVERMPKEREVTRIYTSKPFASRPIRRPKNSWEDVRKDWQAENVKNWKKSVLNRELWKPKTHIEM